MIHGVCVGAATAAVGSGAVPQPVDNTASTPNRRKSPKPLRMMVIA
jgi:hypothetical protein